MNHRRNKVNKFTNGLKKGSVPNARTNNGALAYASTGSYLVDAMNDLPNARNSHYTYGKVRELVKNAYKVDSVLATKMLFWLRDVRGIGQGERKVFQVAMRWLSKEHPDIFQSVYKLIPEYGGWMDVLELIFGDSEGSIIADYARNLLVDYVLETLHNDLHLLQSEEGGISLLAKWLPSESKNNNSETYRRWSSLVRKLGWTPRYYRKMVNALRNELNIVEQKMSENNWNGINYSSVPARAMRNYTQAFKRHDEKGFENYLESVKAGSTKMNVSGLTPRDIVGKALYRERPSYYSVSYYFSGDYDAHWFAFLQKVSEMKKVNALPIIDTSGSMDGADVLVDALAFGIATSQTNTGDFHGLGMIFSDEAEVVDLSGQSLSRLRLPEIVSGSTNIKSAMDLILKTAKKNNVSADELPKFIVIFSDMQFNRGSFGRNFEKTFFEETKRRFKKAGYDMPTVIFWNMTGNDNKPATVYDNNVVMVGGKSYDTLKYILSGLDESVFQTPLEACLEILSHERYDLVEKSMFSGDVVW